MSPISPKIGILIFPKGFSKIPQTLAKFLTVFIKFHENFLQKFSYIFIEVLLNLVLILEKLEFWEILSNNNFFGQTLPVLFLNFFCNLYVTFFESFLDFYVTCPQKFNRSFISWKSKISPELFQSFYKFYSKLAFS